MKIIDEYNDNKMSSIVMNMGKGLFYAIGFVIFIIIHFSIKFVKWIIKKTNKDKK